MIAKKITLLIALFILSAMSAHAVTESEMQQARTIAAICYLRYANNGSGYLDEMHPKSMSELKKGLKAKEKENIKAFENIPVPADFKSWDKAKLVEYWGVTAFNAPGLIAEGKAARSRVKARINAMSVSKPEEEKPAEQPKAETAEKAAPADSSAAQAPKSSAAEELINDAEKEALQADSIAAEQALETAPVKKEDSSTWIYVTILIILVIIVVVLVVYATKTMNSGDKAPAPASGNNNPEAADAEIDAMREKLAKSVTLKNQEISRLTEELQRAENERRELEAKLESAMSRIETLEADKTLLNERLAASKSRDIESVNSRENVRQTPAKRPERRVIYLGRVNARGIFVRADRRFDPTHDVYVLETADGLTGSFYVAPDNTLADIALLTPVETLGGGCEGDFRAAEGASRINTEIRGEAVFEDGCWRVRRKTRISFS